ncbi:hypothetical protein ANCDUO_25758 [Ancylostoma duodenale]|uniref:Uncharacterized protein n=1 Tax=Ancylostoma duodenale TaxID=51022 RepID=A0A0C2BKD0_9BILA|nr:hypothetical protein ANCDUO_25758 [Ancylostoma duodenale]
MRRGQASAVAAQNFISTYLSASRMAR